jgi:hypothetical protein
LPDVVAKADRTPAVEASRERDEAEYAPLFRVRRMNHAGAAGRACPQRRGLRESEAPGVYLATRGVLSAALGRDSPP